MTDATKPDSNEAIQQARIKAQLLADSFVAVFGQEKGRNEHQRAVLDHLAMCAGDGGNAYRFNEAKDGIALVAAGIHRDGAQSMIRIIERQLLLASRRPTEKKAKPTTKR